MCLAAGLLLLTPLGACGGGSKASPAASSSSPSSASSAQLQQMCSLLTDLELFASSDPIKSETAGKQARAAAVGSGIADLRDLGTKGDTIGLQDWCRSHHLPLIATAGLKVCTDLRQAGAEQALASAKQSGIPELMTIVDPMGGIDSSGAEPKIRAWCAKSGLPV
jgi:hypothetical protein